MESAKQSGLSYTLWLALCLTPALPSRGAITVTYRAPNQGLLESCLLAVRRQFTFPMVPGSVSPSMLANENAFLPREFALNADPTSFLVYADFRNEKNMGASFSDFIRTQAEIDLISSIPVENRTSAQRSTLASNVRKVQGLVLRYGTLWFAT